MKPLKIILVSVLFFLIADFANASIPLAPRMSEGGKMDMFGCMLSNEYYIANFAAYQADPQQPKNVRNMQFPICQEIPKVGETQITVDMLDRDVRKKLVSLKVFDNNKQLITETAPTLAKQGYVAANVNFLKPGNYVWPSMLTTRI